MVGYQFWFDPGNLFSGSNSVHFYKFFDASLNTQLLERGFHFSLQKLFSHCTLYSQSSIEMFLTQLKNEACKNNLFLPQTFLHLPKVFNASYLTSSLKSRSVKYYVRKILFSFSTCYALTLINDFFIKRDKNMTCHFMLFLLQDMNGQEEVRYW